MLAYESTRTNNKIIGYYLSYISGVFPTTIPAESSNHIKANVNGKRVSGHIKADKTCGRAVIIIHYSIILPQHFLYISCAFPVHVKDRMLR